MTSTPLPQQAYVWQREWTPAVSAAIREAASRLDGFVVLGADVGWKDGQARVQRPAVDWAGLRAAGQPAGIALRVDPYAAAEVERTSLAADLAKALVAEAAAQGVQCVEFQVDFDCPERKLAQYRRWLPKVRAAIGTVPLIITALPAWLDQSEFARLASEVDGYVLQVHSVTTKTRGEPIDLCDPARAIRWVGEAAKLGRPFVVSLPTYSALVGYDSSGRSLGMALDGVQPSWPAGTRVVDFSPDPEALARLVAAWQKERPAAMTGLVWYRLPVSSVARNWRWPTFAAVLEGRAPRRQLEILAEGGNPVDLSLSNQGEAEETTEVTVVARWEGRAPVAVEALRGWSVTPGKQEARFVRTGVAVPRLLPGSRRVIGWLRFEQTADIHVEIIR